ncbi:hypothetical protein O181_124752 [Austropuccinia psidii MF-1]|uniref:Uncharacterized protein n=1 Tax=Austropuccinia psidii MF-1 TaxID=1389203 RepID=A0A9Q3Q6R8_9BASI|nr:hypothetical protein [Austropuccinia psidii MF-1]
MQEGRGGILAYSDADWGNCRETRCSVTGYLSTFNGCLVLWKTRKQPCLPISTAEAEYRPLCDLISELLWRCPWTEECSLRTDTRPIPVCEDNQNCLNTANGDCKRNGKRMKHLDIQLHFINEVVQSSILRLIYTPTNPILADFLTKSVSRPVLARSLLALGVLRLVVRGEFEN